MDFSYRNKSNSNTCYLATDVILRKKKSKVDILGVDILGS